MCRRMEAKGVTPIPPATNTSTSYQNMSYSSKTEINVLKFTNENNLSAYIIEDVMKSFHFQKIDGVYKQN